MSSEDEFNFHGIEITGGQNVLGKNEGGMHQHNSTKDTPPAAEFFDRLIAEAEEDEQASEAILPASVVSAAKANAVELQEPTEIDRAEAGKLSKPSLFAALKQEHEEPSPDNGWLSALVEAATKHRSTVMRCALAAGEAYLNPVAASSRVAATLLAAVSEAKA